jgi:hypothetical protein
MAGFFTVHFFWELLYVNLLEAIMAKSVLLRPYLKEKTHGTLAR